MIPTFNLGQNVTITISGEAGQVIGVAEYLAGPTQYFVLLKAADGRAVTSWWEGQFLSAA